MEKRFVRPAPGLLVRLEDASRHLDPAGELVPWTSYWRRRLRDQSIIEGRPLRVRRKRRR
ncbi:MAG: DUF2635 domain-containing protein [Immundisolibacterales bacterium]|nr:DUF2635 domain-containing protein [Immundisolibacterales bacterium]